MLRKIANFLGLFILAMFLYKLFGGDIIALLDGIVDIVVKIGDWGSDFLIEFWNKINS